MPGLLTYDEAIAAIRAACAPLGRVSSVPVWDAGGYALAEAVIAPEPNPRFDNSEVDGYAVGRAEDGLAEAVLSLEGSVAAGEIWEREISPGCAVRILTGAPVPPGTYAVTMQEDVELRDGCVVLRESLAAGQCIRLRGADFEAGTELAAIGTVVTPGLVALLAFAGVETPKVFVGPRVAVVTMGDELVSLNETPVGAQIRDTNGLMLRAQVGSMRAQVVVLGLADDVDDFRQLLKHLSTTHDVLVVSAGASVGDRDYLAGVVAELGEVEFHGVSVRPGKPLLFGRIGGSLVFGLPGNPASSFVCFEIFVREALRRFAGWGCAELRWREALTGFRHPAVGREDFMRVCVRDGRVIPVGAQGSFGLRSIAAAEGLARFPADEDVAEGSSCRIYWLR